MWIGQPHRTGWWPPDYYMGAKPFGTKVRTSMRPKIKELPGHMCEHAWLLSTKFQQNSLNCLFYQMYSSPCFHIQVKKSRDSNHFSSIIIDLKSNLIPFLNWRSKVFNNVVEESCTASHDITPDYTLRKTWPLPREYAEVTMLNLFQSFFGRPEVVEVLTPWPSRTQKLAFTRWLKTSK